MRINRLSQHMYQLESTQRPIHTGAKYLLFFFPQHTSVPPGFTKPHRQRCVLGLFTRRFVNKADVEFSEGDRVYASGLGARVQLFFPDLNFRLYLLF